METLIKDFRYALRILIKKPGFTVVAIVALALGIGANTAIFSVINSILLRPLPYPNSDRLVWINENNLANGVISEAASPPDFANWKLQNQSFQDMTAFSRTAFNLTTGGEPERISGASVTGNFFSVLGVNPMMGRAFLAQEDTPGNNHVVILSQGLWQRRFGGDLNIVGSAMTANGISYSIIGVMPASFQNPLPGEGGKADFWTPLGINFPLVPAGKNDYLGVVARLRPGVSLAHARTDMDTIARRLAEQYPAINKGWGVTIMPLQERFVGQIKYPLYVLLGAVCFLLLIACTNVANLLLARSVARQKELGIRTALGAGRGRLVRQLLTESLLLGILGGGLGLLLALWGVALLASLSPADIPRAIQTGLDLRVLGFTMAISLLTGIVFGLAPALQATRLDLNQTLKDGGRGSTEGGGGRIRNLLAMGEIALALMLLLGAGLMIRSFVKLAHVDPGFNSQQIVTLRLLLPRSKYADGPKIAAFNQELLNRVENLPGVAAVSTTSDLPLNGGSNYSAFAIEGRPTPPPDVIVDAESYVISAGYFRTLGTPLKRGRLFTEQDKANGPQAVIINETMARRYWPNEEPLGKRITLNDPQTGPWLTIIGVVGDLRDKDLESAPYPQIFAPFAQVPQRVFSLVVKANTDPLSLVPAIRSQIKGMDQDQPIFNVHTMDELLADSIARPRFTMLLMGVFAVLALILAAVGIYGVVSYSVSQRTHEIGVRMALGAGRQDVLRMVLGQGLKLALIGIAVGLAGGLAISLLLSSLLFGVSPRDPLTFVGIPVLLTAVALLACYVPARRAMKVDPMVALRYE